MGVLLQWIDNNTGEDGHRVYRDTSPMNPASLPSPLATLGADVQFYEDGTVAAATTYYYRISSYVGSSERVSDEISITTTETSTYRNGDVVLMSFDEVESVNGVVWNEAFGIPGIVEGGVTFAPGTRGNSAVFDGTGKITIGGEGEVGTEGPFYLLAYISVDSGSDEITMCSRSSTTTDPSTGEDYDFVVDVLFGELRFFVQTPSGIVQTGTTNFSYDVEFPIFCIFDGTDIHLYVNEVQEDTAAVASEQVNFSSIGIFTIGDRLSPGASQTPWEGTVDEFVFGYGTISPTELSDYVTYVEGI